MPPGKSVCIYRAPAKHEATASSDQQQLSHLGVHRTFPTSSSTAIACLAPRVLVPYILLCDIHLKPDVIYYLLHKRAAQRSPLLALSNQAKKRFSFTASVHNNSCDHSKNAKHSQTTGKLNKRSKY